MSNRKTKPTFKKVLISIKMPKTTDLNKWQEAEMEKPNRHNAKPKAKAEQFDGHLPPPILGPHIPFRPRTRLQPPFTPNWFGIEAFKAFIFFGPETATELGF